MGFNTEQIQVAQLQIYDNEVSKSALRSAISQYMFDNTLKQGMIYSFDSERINIQGIGNEIVKKMQ